MNDFSVKITARGRFYLLARKLVTLKKVDTYYRQITKLGTSVDYLGALLRHATTRVPYYKKMFDGTSNARLDQFPILNKQIIKGHFDALTVDDIEARAWFKNSSGGSTGQPQTFIQDKDFVTWSIATQTYYFRNFLGVEYAAVPKVVLWGSERDLFVQAKSIKAMLVNWLTQTYFFNSFKMTHEEMLLCVKTINKKRPVFIKAYASSVYELAKFIKENKLSVYSPQFVYSSAESMKPFMREVIEEVFACKVYDFYGSREAGAIAGECSRGSMHVFSFNSHVEIVGPQNNPVGVGEEGRILVTTLHNYAMPLIRYEIGDTAVLGGRCECGNELPVIKRITGRVTDHFLLKNGALIHGEYFTHLFYFRDWVKEFQVVQEELDKVQIFLVPTSTKKVPQEDVVEIEAKIRIVMGEDCRIEWKYVDAVPRTPQGKMLFTRSLVYGK